MKKTEGKPRIAVSSCLLGNRVRYDGGHKFNPYVLEVLEELFEIVPFCPEVESGMSIPREPVNLVDDGGRVRLVGAESGVDYTERVVRWSEEKVVGFESDCVRGILVKSKSPSCGLRKIPVFEKLTGEVSRRGKGLFVGVVNEKHPEIPVADDEEFMTRYGRVHFLDRVLVKDAFERSVESGSVEKVGEFLRRHELVFRARDSGLFERARAMVSEMEGGDPQSREAMVLGIRVLVDEMMSRKVTREGDLEALRYCVYGWLSGKISADELAEIENLLDEFGRNEVEFKVVASAIWFLGRTYGDAAVMTQYFVSPRRLLFC